MIAITNVLVATDFGRCSEAALKYGCDLARRFDATLHVIHVVDDVFGRQIGMGVALSDPSGLQRALEESSSKQLDQLLGGVGNVPTKRVMRTSSAPAAEIVAYAKDASIDLIVVGTHGRGAVAHMLLGSVAEKVARTAACPVLTVPAPEPEWVEPDPLLVLARA